MPQKPACLCGSIGVLGGCCCGEAAPPQREAIMPAAATRCPAAAEASSCCSRNTTNLPTAPAAPRHDTTSSTSKSAFRCITDKGCTVVAGSSVVGAAAKEDAADVLLQQLHGGGTNNSSTSAAAHCTGQAPLPVVDTTNASHHDSHTFPAPCHIVGGSSVASASATCASGSCCLFSAPGGSGEVDAAIGRHRRDTQAKKSRSSRHENDKALGETRAMHTHSSAQPCGTQLTPQQEQHGLRRPATSALHRMERDITAWVPAESCATAISAAGRSATTFSVDCIAPAHLGQIPSNCEGNEVSGGFDLNLHCDRPPRAKRAAGLFQSRGLWAPAAAALEMDIEALGLQAGGGLGALWAAHRDLNLCASHHHGGQPEQWVSGKSALRPTPNVPFTPPAATSTAVGAGDQANPEPDSARKQSRGRGTDAGSSPQSAEGGSHTSDSSDGSGDPASGAAPACYPALVLAPHVGMAPQHTADDPKCGNASDA
jgi:hypothetical protein